MIEMYTILTLVIIYKKCIFICTRLFSSTISKRIRTFSLYKGINLTTDEGFPTSTVLAGFVFFFIGLIGENGNRPWPKNSFFATLIKKNSFIFIWRRCFVTE